MRGGFRGRGRGRGGGAAAEPRAMQLIPGMAKLDHRAVTAGTLKYGGVLYPPLEHAQIAFLALPSGLEESALGHGADMDAILQDGLPGSSSNPTPWRIPDTRKVVGIEIETYSDRQRLPPASTSGKLDPDQLRLDPAYFPPSLWKLHFEGVGPQGKKLTRDELDKKRKRALDDDGEPIPDEAEKSDAESEEGDFDFDDDQSDHQDYDANYFDNGEGDDDEGDEDEGEGRGLDD